MSIDTAPTTHFDFAAFRRAIEAKDADALAAYYRDDAVMTGVTKDHPPASPEVIAGLAAITDHYRDICTREMSHSVSREVVSDDRAAFTVECLYPDGTNVVCACLLDLEDGRIAREFDVVTWDD